MKQVVLSTIPRKCVKDKRLCGGIKCQSIIHGTILSAYVHYI